MKQTVAEFAARHSFTEPDASKILRRAELGGRLSATETSEYKRTYHGSHETFDALARHERVRRNLMASVSRRNLEKTRKPKAAPPFAGLVK